MVKDGAGKEIVSRRPDTFAALMDLEDIDTDTLKKDARYANPNQRLFYSRKWSDMAPRSLQTNSLKFNYPLCAVQPFAVDVDVKKPYSGIRLSLIVMDQHPDKLTASDGHTPYGSVRTFEQLEADMTSIFENVALEWLGKWALYESSSTYTWSPTPIAGAVVKWRMKDAMLTGSVEGTFYRDVGVDKVAGIQGFVSLKMPRLDCYLPVGAGRRVAFDYGTGTETPHRPDGLPGGGDEHETATT